MKLSGHSRSAGEGNDAALRWRSGYENATFSSARSIIGHAIAKPQAEIQVVHLLRFRVSYRIIQPSEEFQPFEVNAMPMHDWTNVSAGTFHDFHNSWITHLKERLNAGLLPDPYYALGEQRAGDTGLDLLALRTVTAMNDADDSPFTTGNGMVAVLDAPPRVHLSQEASLEAAFYLAKRRTLVIRHATGDRIVALVEIVSPSNKHNRDEIESFVDKVLAALRQGIHVLW